MVAAVANLPPSNANLAILIGYFAAKGLTPRDMVALSGAHTVGQTRCGIYRDRVYNEPNIAPEFAAKHRAACPAAGGDGAWAPLDEKTPSRFDNKYFGNLVAGRGLLHSDQELFSGQAMDALVRHYSNNNTAFAKDFVAAMVKMGKLMPLIGGLGEIRLNCRKVVKLAGAELGGKQPPTGFAPLRIFFFYCGWKSFSLAEVCKRVGESTATAPLAIKLMGPWIAWAAWSNEGQRRSKTTLMISGIGLAAVEGREEMGSIGTEEVAQWEKADGDGGGEEERILVSVRLRPLNAKEIECNDTLDWECISNSTIIFKNNLPDRSMHPTAYTFDRVFGCNCSTKDVYMEGAKEVVLSVVSGINATIFAYGQTSSGKTYTMTGLTEYSVEDIYDYIKRHEEREFILKFSAMEIYNEAVRDLLSMDSTPHRLLDDQERGTIVEKLTEETLRDQSHFKELLSLCEAQRQIGETSLNEMSSRSHQILRLTIESSAKEFVNRSSSSTLSATVNFVDLAGSERASQSLSVGARLKEGCHINRSLLTLGTVIRKLSKGTNGHIPYRDSKLTRILQSSLGGNARTAIICTMSPAHSHVEQSRNTLFFANCAKQVVTNAQVNVVMSDKALVKHLQKKLARLESELRYPGAASCISHFEALRDKDSQIEKMEREIKELIQQRDLAHSQFEDLLRAVGDDQASRQWDELSRSSISHARNTLEDVCSISGTSCIGYQSPDFGSASVFPPDENNNQSECEMEHFCKLDNEENVTPSHSASSPTFSGIILQQRRAKTLESSLENSDDHCREVRCIEIHALSINKNEEFIHSLTEEKDNLPSEPELADEEKIVNPRLQYETCTGLKPSEEQPSEIIARTVDVVKLCLNGSSQRPTMLPAMTPKDLVLTRSRSCNSKLMFSSPSFRYSDVEQNHKISPNDYMNEFPGNLDCGSRKVPELEYHAEFEAHSHEESQESERFSIHDVEAHNNRILAEEDMTNVTNHLNEVPDDQDVQQKLVEDYEVEGTLKDVGIDSASFSVESPSRWPFDFERKQQEIIELWHACNVSLIHRTYFFLLVNGDPADSFYMEVEHRRLSFLRKTSYHRTSEDSHSVRYLRREREMLSRQMLKKLSPEERITLYTKWGIALNSKRRRMQLACLVWTNTGLTHVRDSASIVAKLVRPLEQGQDLKEMFGLSFIPKQTNHRYFSWKHTKSSLT